MIKLRAHLLSFIALIFLWPTAASAAYPCPNGPGPGENQVGTMGGSNGIGVTPLCDSDGSATDDGGFDDDSGRGGAYSAPSTPRMKGHAINVWGALVWDPKLLIANYKESKNIGIAMGQKTKQDAIDYAISECENDGGKHCQVQATISGSCLALAGGKGQIVWATQKHTDGDNAFDTSAAAEKKALAKCNEKGYQSCAVFYSDCSIIKWVWD
jgi:hypothetical protein